MDAADLISQFGPAAATSVVAVVSAVVPFVYVEVYLLAAVVLVPGGYATWTLGIVAADVAHEPTHDDRMVSFD
jgi:hypothetical protein